MLLKALDDGALHGCHRRAASASVNDVLTVEEGSFIRRYRMERRGWLASAWALTDTGRQARFYKMTRGPAHSGRRPRAGCADHGRG
jgi:hypothetical protein